MLERDDLSQVCGTDQGVTGLEQGTEERDEREEREENRERGQRGGVGDRPIMQVSWAKRTFRGLTLATEGGQGQRRRSNVITARLRSCDTSANGSCDSKKKKKKSSKMHIFPGEHL